MASERINQVARLIRLVKEEIINRGQQGISRNEFDDLVTEKTKELASILGKTYSTCSDKMCRQLGITKSVFCSELWNFFASNQPAINTALGTRIYNNRTRKDTQRSIIHLVEVLKNY